MRPYIARSRYIRMPHIVPDKDAVQAVITGSHDHSPCPIGDDFSDANALVLQPLRKLVLISMRRDENLSLALSRLCCRTVSGIGCVTGGVPTGDLLGGGGGWMPGTYDAETNTVWWGTANPSPLYDWSGSDWQKSGPRPGTNLYTTSVIALDPDTGKLKFYHQELPHDADSETRFSRARLLIRVRPGRAGPGREPGEGRLRRADVGGADPAKARGRGILRGERAQEDPGDPISLDRQGRARRQDHGHHDRRARPGHGEIGFVLRSFPSAGQPAAT